MTTTAPTSTLRTVPRSELPEIHIAPNVTRMADEAIAALARMPGIYERGGRLAHVVRVPEPPKFRKGVKLVRAPGSPTIRVLAYASLFERLSAAAHWCRKTKTGVRDGLPSTPAVRAVFDRGEWGGIPSLVGVTTAPVFRPDGLITQTPGYDPDTGLLYWPNATYAPVPKEPTIDDARDAYRFLCETVRAFPFAEEHHKAAWVCSVLSILARPAIDGPVPMFVMDANTRGVGKTKLVDAAFSIALGYGAACTALPEQNEEIRKTLSCCVLAGDQALLFDNIKRKLGGEAIEGAVTSTIWKARRLGSDEQMHAPMRMVLFATGNNATMTSDLSRRSIQIRLESPLENPEDRSDTFDLVSWIDEKRHHLVTWALTILRAWHVAGRPQPSKTMGSFEAWSEVIPQAVAWVSGIDPLAARASSDVENDEERMHLSAIVTCLDAMTAGGGTISAKQMIVALYGTGDRHDGTTTMDHHPSYGAAREAIESVTFCKPGQTPVAQKLGRYFDARKGQVVKGMRIFRGPVSQGTLTWTVKKGG